MKNSFLKASEYRTRKEKRSSVRCNSIINSMNFKIARGQDQLVLNTGDRNVPHLNESDIEWLKKQANKMGWEFTAQEDNYQSTSYYLKPLE
ncbi:MAG: hypothetical protein JETCAE03_34850 [Ignavibacteriaceae bacterium]|jgi:hypothetical protein|nr:MAG: hypothetical protein JETCAE03_34850 [Ignavibacteriaceae bacterium]